MVRGLIVLFWGLSFVFFSLRVVFLWVCFCLGVVFVFLEEEREKSRGFFLVLIFILRFYGIVSRVVFYYYRFGLYCWMKLDWVILGLFSFLGFG